MYIHICTYEYILINKSVKKTIAKLENLLPHLMQTFDQRGVSDGVLL